MFNTKCIEVKISEIKFYVSHNCTTFRKVISLRLGKYRVMQKSLDRRKFATFILTSGDFYAILYIATHNRDNAQRGQVHSHEEHIFIYYNQHYTHNWSG